MVEEGERRAKRSKERKAKGGEESVWGKRKEKKRQRKSRVIDDNNGS
jgi:hypothetical protein